MERFGWNQFCTHTLYLLSLSLQLRSGSRLWFISSKQKGLSAVVPLGLAVVPLELAVVPLALAVVPLEC